MSASFKCFATIATIAASATFTAGCFHKNEAKNPGDANAAATAEDSAIPGEEIPMEPDPLSELFMKAEELFASGATNETVKLLSDALENKDFADYRTQIFPSIVRLLLMAEDVDGARERVLAAYASGDDALAESVLGSIFFHYANTGDTSAALAWTDTVMKIENLPQRVRRSFVEWHITAAIDAGDDECVAKAAEALFASAPEDGATEILRRSMETLISRGKNDLLADIIARAGKSVTSDPATRDLLAVMRIRLLALQNKWDALPDAFAAASTLSDKDLHYALRTAIPQAAKANRFGIVDTICEAIACAQTSNTMSRGYAARQWLDSASKTDLAEVPARLETLIDKNLKLSDVSSVFLRHAYDNVDDLKFTSTMKAIAERISSLSGDDSRTSLRTILLDYSFLLDDYDTALAILAERISGYDDNWHNMATAKIKAHKALKENRPLDAIREFRAFMAVIQTSDEETSDPATGIVHTRDMILGRNAARIGDIYAGIPDAEKAAAAYTEARDYYKAALEKARDKDTIEVINKELSAIEGK